MVVSEIRQCNYWSIDNNILITLNHFPSDIFQSLWLKIAEFGQSQHWCICEPVVSECHIPEWQKWFKEHYEIVTPIDELYVKYVSRLQLELEENEMPLTDPSSTKNMADPFIIALALMKEQRDLRDLRKRTNSSHCGVLSLEAPKPSKINIPSVCQYYDVNCLNLNDYMREQGWSFSLVISSP
ncbi:MAG: DUF4411 family protein [bacterium]